MSCSIENLLKLICNPGKNRSVAKIDIYELTLKEVELLKYKNKYYRHYDKDWYFRIVNYVPVENFDVDVKFLHPKGLAS